MNVNVVEYIENKFKIKNCLDDKKKKKVLNNMINSFGHIVISKCIDGKIEHGFFNVPDKYKYLLNKKESKIK